MKDATADYSEEFMHAALVINLPNYASAIADTHDRPWCKSGFGERKRWRDAQE